MDDESAAPRSDFSDPADADFGINSPKVKPKRRDSYSPSSGRGVASVGQGGAKIYEYCQVLGIRIHYRLRRSPDPECKDVIYLFHGFLSHMFTWEQIFDDLAESTGLNVLAWDRPAFGYTERKLPPKKNKRNPDDPDMYSQDFASDVGVELLKKLGFEQALFVGHSVGGLLSMLTYLRKPEVFKGIILIDAPLVQGDPSGLLQWSMNREVLGKYLTKSLVKNIQGIFVNMYSDPVRAADPVLRDKYARPFETVQDAQKALWRYIKRNISYGPKLRETLQMSLPRFNSVPVLVMSGTFDKVAPASESRRLQEQIEGSKFIEISRAGHCPQEENPKDTLEAIVGFALEILTGGVDDGAKKKTKSSRTSSPALSASSSPKSSKRKKASSVSLSPLATSPAEQRSPSREEPAFADFTAPDPLSSSTGSPSPKKSSKPKQKTRNSGAASDSPSRGSSSASKSSFKITSPQPASQPRPAAPTFDLLTDDTLWNSFSASSPAVASPTVSSPSLYSSSPSSSSPFGPAEFMLNQPAPSNIHPIMMTQAPVYGDPRRDVQKPAAPVMNPFLDNFDVPAASPVPSPVPAQSAFDVDWSSRSTSSPQAQRDSSPAVAASPSSFSSTNPFAASATPSSPSSRVTSSPSMRSSSNASVAYPVNSALNPRSSIGMAQSIVGNGSSSEDDNSSEESSDNIFRGGNSSDLSSEDSD